MARAEPIGGGWSVFAVPFRDTCRFPRHVARDAPCLPSRRLRLLMYAWRPLLSLAVGAGPRAIPTWSGECADASSARRGIDCPFCAPLRRT